MDIHLSPESERFIEAQLQLGEFHSASEVIESLIQAKSANGSAGNGSATAPMEMGAKQRAAILQAIRECEKLAGPPANDGFSNRDHDRVLYGERS